MKNMRFLEISRNTLRTYSRKIQPYSTYFLHLIDVNSFVDLPGDVCQHTKRIKVDVIRL